MAEVFTLLLAAMPDAAALLKLDGTCLAVNAYMKRCLEAASVSVSIGACFARTVFDEEGAARLNRALETASTGAPIEIESAFVSKAGARLPKHLSLSPMAPEGQVEPVLVLRFGRDSLAYPLAATSFENDLAPVHGRLQDQVIELPGFLSTEDIRKKLESIIGATVDIDILSERLRECRDGKVAALYLQAPSMERAEDKGVPTEPSDESDCIEVRLLKVPGSTARQSPVIAVVGPSMACRQEAEEYKRLALTDMVTRMPNRRAIYKQAESLLRSSDPEATSKGLGVFCVDLDDFKKINDLAGHAAGDEMLRRVGGALTTVLEPYGMAGRLGGDEFGGLARIDSIREAEELASEMREALDRLHLQEGGRIFTISGSIGVGFVRSELIRQVDPDELFKLADICSMKGKRAGGGTVIVDEFQPSSRARETKHVLADDLERPEQWLQDVTLQATPVFNISDARPLGVRTLFSAGKGRAALRRRTGRTGDEGRGLHALIDCWALDQVLDFLRANGNCKWCSVTLSPASFDDAAIQDLMRLRLTNDPLLAGRLCIEVSEPDYLREPGRAFAFLSRAAGFGCQTAIGEFSGHWSVFEGLAEARVGWIRLRPSVTVAAAIDRKKRGILKGLICTAREIGIRTLAQGVEKDADVVLMSSLGIDAVEGPYIGEPSILGTL
ncbi:diguanylate cyclase domain-containing protein [Roseibium sp.]|uniref:diguanylate cyclase domain-containing protein n=1 Tax=Roseibium sp. TaxID=1936156 RepID=UPI003A97AB35